MAEFQPYPEAPISIAGVTYQFMPHPLFADAPGWDEVYVIEGGEALIYQLGEPMTATLWALKVPKPSFRGEQHARSAEALAAYRAVPGLALANRLCLTRATSPDTLARYPDLAYATLMPWLDGVTWAGFLLDRAAGERYTGQQALRLASACAHALWELEAHRLAHTDVASGNIIIRELSDARARLELLDVENLYIPGFPPPPYLSHGAPGYQHPALDARGQWRPEGDRFAGAILLAEMLAWWDPAVRAATPDGSESLFQPSELQREDGARWSLMRDALWSLCPSTLELFDQAWASTRLEECPELGAWALALLEAQGINAAAFPGGGSDAPQSSADGGA